MPALHSVYFILYAISCTLLHRHTFSFLLDYKALCICLIVQCQVQSKDRRTMATQKPWARILTSVLAFERAIWISWRPRRNNWWSGYSAILKLSSLDIFSESMLPLLCFSQFWESTPPSFKRFLSIERTFQCVFKFYLRMTHVDGLEAIGCQNNGACVKINEEYTCECGAQWIGKFCETKNSEYN